MEIFLFGNAKIKTEILHFKTFFLEDYSLEDFCLLHECLGDSLNFKKILTYKSLEKVCLLSNFLDLSKLSENQTQNLEIMRDMYTNFREYPLYVKIRQPKFTKIGTCTKRLNLRITLFGGYDFVCPERMPRKINYQIREMIYQEIQRIFRFPESPLVWAGGTNKPTSDFRSSFKRGDNIYEEEWWEMQQNIIDILNCTGIPYKLFDDV